MEKCFSICFRGARFQGSFCVKIFAKCKITYKIRTNDGIDDWAGGFLNSGAETLLLIKNYWFPYF